jgi:leucyl-tRNA synthetase
MKTQLTELGFDFDWDRQLSTSEQDYYKHTQTIFKRMRAAGLAYQEESNVNWDPVDQTVLANEQIDSEGRSWRSGARVEKKKMKQWYLDIRKYADEMLKGV